MTRRADRHWRQGRLLAAGYDWGIQHDVIARPAARLLWGYDLDLAAAELARLAAAGPATVILDVPCGGGIALRGLRPAQPVRYIAADISPGMLRRTVRRANAQGLRQVIAVRADAGALPFRPASIDLCLTYNGLHCVADPPAAVTALAQLLTPGGKLRGTMVLSAAGRRRDLVIRLLRTAGAFGPGGTADDLRDWLTAAGLVVETLTRCGAVAHFTAVRPPARACSGAAARSGGPEPAPGAPAPPA